MVSSYKVHVRKVTIDEDALWRVIETDPRAAAAIRHIAEEIQAAAILVFVKSQRWDNEDRTSETTPPKYLKSFSNKRLKRIRGLAWEVRNSDPSAVWVEFGAHAGGNTFVLRYRPLGRGLDIVAARNL